MRAMQTPLGKIVLIMVGLLGLLLLVSINAALIGLTLFLVRRSRAGRPPSRVHRPAWAMRLLGTKSAYHRGTSLHERCASLRCGH
jgi:hypothetical protein